MPTVAGDEQFAFFTKDAGGWWVFRGVHHDQEVGLALVERYKHDPACGGILTVALPSCRKIYECDTSGGAT